MQRVIPLGLVVALFGGALALSQKAPTPEEMSRTVATKLFQSLSERQKQQAAKDWHDKNRLAIRFATEGTGTPIAEMSPEQRALVDELFRSMLSDFGSKRYLEMGGKGRVTFYGDPGADERFACRIDKNNHLTLTYAEYGKEAAGDFGPIVLGAKAAGEATVWVEEDKLALELAAAFTKEEAKLMKTKGLAIGELSETPRDLAVKLLEQRLAIFSPMNRKILDEAIRRDGGVDKLRIALWGDTSKSIDDGGRYHWRIVGPSFVCTWQSDGKNHPHMTLTAKR